MTTHRIEIVSLFALASLFVACGGDQKKPAESANKPMIGERKEDQGRCDVKGRDDRDVTESSSPNSVAPNIRRVYGQSKIGDELRRTMLCREVDTNLDGAKDLVRTYNDKGEALSESADTDYDGKIDTWITYAGGRISRIELDHNADGKADETKFYTGGKLSRLQSDTNFDGKPDQFEVYRDGQLERVGLDVNFDGQVDQWQRDELRAAEAKSEAAKSEPPKAEEKPASDSSPSGDDQGKGGSASTPKG